MIEDNNYIATGSEDKTVKIWNILTCECVNTLEGHRSYIKSIIVLQDIKLIASASHDCTIKIWNYKKQSSMCERTLSGHTKPILCLSHYNKELIASGGEDSAIKIWNWREGLAIY